MTHATSHVAYVTPGMVHGDAINAEDGDMTTNTATATTYLRNYHGATETNGLIDGAAYHGLKSGNDMLHLADVARLGGKVTRVRMIGSRWEGLDLSYVDATLPDGAVHGVYLPGSCRLMREHQIKGHLIEWAKSENVYAKAIDLLDEGNWSILYG